MELERAALLSLAAYPFAFASLLVSGFLGYEAYLEMPGYPIPRDTPNLFRVCPEPPLEDDVRWAVGEWNRALENYGVNVRMEVTMDGCTARVKPTDNPLQQEFGGSVAFPPRKDLDVSKIPAEDIRFWMFDEIQITVWNTADGRLRRAIILHELGHMLLLNHIREYKGFGPKPVMLVEIDTNNPPESVTELDAHFVWLRHSFCRERACGTFYVWVPNPYAASTVSIALSGAIATVLVLAGGRNGGRSEG